MTRRDLRQARVLASPNAFKLATFGFNAQGGVTITKAPGTADTDWAQQVRIARASDRAGIEAIVPGARWMGYGGETNFQGRSFETLSWAAGLAGVTERCQVFATVHFTTIHPVRLAKTIATIDHIAGGRLGINWVAGWNPDEAAMFIGEQREHDDRYAYAEDFLGLLNQLLDTPGESAWHGPFFDYARLVSDPKPIQSPRPVYMAAGLSPRGRDFAGGYADISFVPAHGGPDAMRDLVANTKGRAAANGREIKTFGQSVIVCRDSEAEARDYLNWYVEEQGDFAAAENLVRMLFGETRDEHGNVRQLPPEVQRARARGAVAAHGGAVILGTPTQVVEQYQRLAATGMDGATVSWLNFEEGLEQFRTTLLPLMIDAGLRADEGIDTTHAADMSAVEETA